MTTTTLEQRLSRSALLLSADQLSRLARARVMLFGLGGVGSYAAEALARAGVGRLILVDADTVSASNINRQLPALTSTVGLPKARVERDRLIEINPDAEIIAVEAFHLPESPVEIPPDTDYVADAIDTVTAKLDLAVTCESRGVPLLSCMGMGNRYDPTQIRIGDVFATSGDPLCRVMRRELRKRGVEKLSCVYSLEPAHAPQGGESKPSGHPAPGSLPFVPAVAGLYMAYRVVADLCGF